MPTDDEFRRVAEDVRALVRSLMRDVRAGVDDVRKQAHQSGRSVGDEIRNAARQSRAEWRAAARDHRHQHRHGHGWSPPGGSGALGTAQFPAPARAPRPPRPARPPRPPLRHRHDSSTVLGLVAVVLGLSWLAATTHLFAVPWRAAVAVALMVLGAAMVVTARTDWALSRRAWPTFIGAALIALLVVGSASVAWPSFGDRNLSWASWSVVPGRIDTGSGHTVVDLTRLGDVQAPRTLEVHEGAGSLEIRLPATLHLYLDAKLYAGTIRYPDSHAAGVGPSVNKDLGPSGGSVLTLRVRGGFGSVQIERATA